MRTRFPGLKPWAEVSCPFGALNPGNETKTATVLLEFQETLALSRNPVAALNTYGSIKGGT
jgi:hypothetical protein